MALEVKIGKTMDLGVKGAQDNQFTYSSTNPSVASVDAAGIVTAIAAGFTSIRVRRNADGMIEFIPVVVKPLSSFSVTIDGKTYGEA